MSFGVALDLKAHRDVLHVAAIVKTLTHWERTVFSQIYLTSSSSVVSPMAMSRIWKWCSFSTDWITPLIWSQPKPYIHRDKIWLKMRREYLPSRTEAVGLQEKWPNESEGPHLPSVSQPRTLSSLISASLHPMAAKAPLSSLFHFCLLGLVSR